MTDQIIFCTQQIESAVKQQFRRESDAGGLEIIAAKFSTSPPEKCNCNRWHEYQKWVQEQKERFNEAFKPLARMMADRSAHVVVLLDDWNPQDVSLLVEFCNHKNRESLEHYYNQSAGDAWSPPFQFGIYREDARKQFRFAVADLALFHKKLEEIGNFDGRTLLLTGPTGCGKSAFARFLHNVADGKDSPFHEFNMAQLPQDAALFRDHFEGHKKGAFTDAKGQTNGAFRECKNGALFLDELEGLTYQNQIALLNYMQDLEDLGRVLVGRVGDPKREDGVPVRLLLATNMAIERASVSKKLREDFVFRTRQIHLAGLREIFSDENHPHAPILYLLLLTQKRWRALETMREVRSFTLAYHPKLVSIDSQFRQEMRKFEWRGNLRQLERLAESILPPEPNRICGEGIDELWKNWKRMQYRVDDDPPINESASLPRSASMVSLHPAIAEKYRDLLLLSLKLANNNCTVAAKMLRMDIRTFQKKLKAFGLDTGFQ